MPITINLSSVTPNTPFTVGGVLSGYTTAPTLVFSDKATLAVPAPTGVRASTTGTSVSLSYSAVTPTVTAPDWSPLPNGAVVTATAFTFTHPGVAVGTQSLAVADSSDHTITAFETYSVTVAESADGTTIFTPTFITGSDGTKWSLNPAGQVTVNGVADASTANVTEMEYKLSDHRVYVKNTSNQWYYKVKPTDTSWTQSAAGPV